METPKGKLKNGRKYFSDEKIAFKIIFKKIGGKFLPKSELRLLFEKIFFVILKTTTGKKRKEL